MTPAERLEYLEEENRQLRSALRGTDEVHFPSKWNLNPSEKRILKSLSASVDGFRTREALHMVAARSEDADQAMLSVHMSNLRKKLAPYGVSIKTIYGHGYKIDGQSRSMILSERRKAALNDDTHAL